MNSCRTFTYIGSPLVWYQIPAVFFLKVVKKRKENRKKVWLGFIVFDVASA